MARFVLTYLVQLFYLGYTFRLSCSVGKWWREELVCGLV